ncbi:hypothetical protein WKT22_00504 [Candidatus Lokiarchaeum ossiferum]
MNKNINFDKFNYIFAYYRVSTDLQTLGSQELTYRNWIKSIPNIKIVK